MLIYKCKYLVLLRVLFPLEIQLLALILTFIEFLICAKHSLHIITWNSQKKLFFWGGDSNSILRMRTPKTYLAFLQSPISI